MTTMKDAVSGANFGTIDAAKWSLAHNDTVYCQTIFPALSAYWKPNTLAYGPCWAMLKPGMTLEPHTHPIQEFYVFTSGTGTMRLGADMFPVRPGIAVNIPPNVEHTVTVDPAATEQLVFVSIGISL